MYSSYVAEPENRTKHSSATTWKPGQSGNPGGRPAGLRKLVADFEKHGTAVMQRLLDLTKSEDEKVAKAACDSFLDRLYGKPTQPVSGDADRPPVGGGLSALADPAVRESIQRALTGGAGPRPSGDAGDPGNAGDGTERAARDAAVGPGAAPDPAGVVDR